LEEKIQKVYNKDDGHALEAFFLSPNRNSDFWWKFWVHKHGCRL